MPRRSTAFVRAARTAATLGLAIALPAIAVPQPAAAQSAQGHPDWPGAGDLFVGTCYQPIDRSPAQIKQDIAIMKAAGFNMVRMGDLSWDSFEPEEGRFTFEWFDDVIAQMHKAGIKVIVDIPGQPAPIWLHKAYPGVDLVNQEGARLHPATRYWDNISDPDYRRLMRRMAEKIMQRYAHNPAVIALGYTNEIGNGQMSFSEADRQRFITWLQHKYGSIEALNKAWATQRWSRRINTWDQVDLPYLHGPGPNERYLDLHRYWSDDTVGALRELEAVRKQFAPNLPVASNFWPTAWGKGFDYLRAWEGISTYGAQGFYPGEPVGAAFEVMMNKAGHTTPVWFNEFTAGGGGFYGTPGRSRMWAYFGLLYYSQTFLAWTFNSHSGGEEQALFGLVDHDGRPSWKVDEFATIAREFKAIKALGFPRYHTPQVALHYSFDTNWLTSPPEGPNTMQEYFKGKYQEQVKAGFEPFYRDNIDTAVIDIGHDAIDKYKLVVLSSAYVMDQATSDAIRKYVANGGTVIMTGYSAKVDSTAKWFETPLPGGLTDVFGLRTNEFYRAPQPLKVSFAGQALTGTDDYYEVLEPSTAQTLATFENTPKRSPAITVNRFGKGRAIYLATAPQAALLGPLVRSLYAQLGIARGPETPDGVVAREVDGRTLYVNTTPAPITVPIAGSKTGAISRQRYTGHLDLPGYGAEIVE
ncbi:beta-galactosidase [Novosphingobium sp. SG720]|uniref:beta-galactosidase n=1 Tax=Novosphingobium sp. SG720 TaxID=2586998 RepID=UPI001445F62A|nr:beta-galactosidase [Novosphingobium sp. SG720]NKJ42241.1 beta-galactosidase [Novosphingobium sp. SG720]